MDTPEFKKIWQKNYRIVPENIKKIKQVPSVVTGFNTNIDAIVKITGNKLAELIKNQNLSLADLENIEACRICSYPDVLKGLYKCFKKGIAEEWICEGKELYAQINNLIGFDKLQIGGQGGIMANTLALSGVQKVYVHTNSLPKMQAEQFIASDHLLSFDQDGQIKPAYLINRAQDTPLIHLILEFSRGDILAFEGKRIRCPKSNRFIVTYDPLNLNLVINPAFINFMRQEQVSYVILSGFHALLSHRGGQELIQNIVPEIKLWRIKSPQSVYHLEIASTQDSAILRSIIENIVPLTDSVGINERETIDVLKSLNEKALAKRCSEQTTAENLLRGIAKIKEKTGVKRIQLHMYGLYLTLQDKDFHITPSQNLAGMMTASTLAAVKARTGSIAEPAPDVAEISDVGLIELDSLATHLGQPTLSQTGIGHYLKWDIIAVPTILVENPVALVGMGDTISSISLISAG